jgi:hypothetical protein
MPRLRSLPSYNALSASSFSLKRETTSTHKTFTRNVATARRTSKALRPVPALSAAPASKYSIPGTNQIVFNPPPSAPTPYHTPPIFLPSQDPRRILLTPSYAHANPYRANDKELPPAVKPPREKTYHLSKEDIEEMRRLRQSDEWTWTRKRLADKFGCTEFFVGMCVQASHTRMEWAKTNLDRVKQRWGDKRRSARDERTKRRELWGRDA